MMFWKDKRAKCIYEYFTEIRIIKYYAWEEAIEKKINEIRETESIWILKNNNIRIIIDACSNVSPLLISIIIIVLYVAAGNEFTASKAYTVLALFNLIMHPIRMMMYCIILVMQTKVNYLTFNLILYNFSINTILIYIFKNKYIGFLTKSRSFHGR